MAASWYCCQPLESFLWVMDRGIPTEEIRRDAPAKRKIAERGHE
jgi:hypothetical protein